jgi:hypothetical protein
MEYTRFYFEIELVNKRTFKSDREDVRMYVAKNFSNSKILT